MDNKTAIEVMNTMMEECEVLAEKLKETAIITARMNDEMTEYLRGRDNG